MVTVQVRQLIAVGARTVGDDYIPNAVGDVYEIDDQPLHPADQRPGGPATMVGTYVAAGYVELAP